jgi:ParB/RepB/Spo0J family partition protein
VRQSQSPEKLDELAQSIREEGVIVPVKLRKNGDGYTLVYGHRRVAAAKMAGLKEIEAIVEDVPEKKLLTQALIENVVREDMPGIEIAKALAQIIKDTGCTQAELAAKMGWQPGRVSNYIGMLDPELGLVDSKNVSPAIVSEKHVQEARAGTDSLKDAAKVLKYAGEKELSARDTRQVAEVVRHAAEFGGDKAVARVLAQSANQILATAPTLAPHKPKAIVREIEGKVLFQWVKDPRVILAEEGIKAVSACVSAIARSDQDRGGGKAALKRLRTMVANALGQIDDVLRGM